MKRFLVVYGICSMALLGCGGSGTVSASQLSSAAPGAPASEKPVATSGSNNPAAASAVDRDVTIPAGTALSVTLDTSVGSDISHVEEPVRGHLRRAVIVHGEQVLPAGAVLLGNVTAAERPGRVKGRGYVAVRFNEVETREGRERIATRTVGRLAPATKGKDAIEILAPASGAAVVGRLADGKKGAREGAVIGGAAGTGYVLSTRGKDVRLGQGARLLVRLTRAVTIRVPR
jgi:hypothetical protein